MRQSFMIQATPKSHPLLGAFIGALFLSPLLSGATHAGDRSYAGLSPDTVAVFLEAEDNRLSPNPYDTKTRWEYLWQEQDLDPRSEPAPNLREILKNRKPNLNATRSDGLTPLTVAITYNNVPAVGILAADPRVDVNQLVRGKTPLMIAIEEQDLLSVKTFLNLHGRIDLNAKSAAGETALSIALKTASAPKSCLDRHKLVEPDAAARCDRSDQIVDLILASPDLNLNQWANFEGWGSIPPIAIAAALGRVQTVQKMLGDPRLDRTLLPIARRTVDTLREIKAKESQNINAGAAALGISPALH